MGALEEKTMPYLTEVELGPCMAGANHLGGEGRLRVGASSIGGGLLALLIAVARAGAPPKGDES